MVLMFSSNPSICDELNKLSFSLVISLRVQDEAEPVEVLETDLCLLVLVGEEGGIVDTD